MHSDLIDKLEALDGPSREADALIATTVGGFVYEKRGRDQKAWFYPADGGWRRQLNGIFADKLPAYTASLDAVVALVERVLSGWDWAVSNFGEDGCEGRVWKHGWYDDTWIRAFHTHPAIALLIATLAQLAAREGQCK